MTVLKIHIQASKQCLQHLVDCIHYRPLQTYSSNSSGARLDGQVFRVAILMTDGQSQDGINVCNFRSVAEAANAVHAASPPIVVLA